MEQKEIETLAELISIKTSERYMQMTKDLVENKIDFTEKLIAQSIELHKADCEARKYKNLKSLSSAGVGGIIVWVLNKIF